MKKVLFSALLLILACAASAQDTGKIDDIKKLLELTGSGKMGKQVMDAMLPSLKAMAPDVDAKFWDDFMAEVHPEELMDLVVPIYDKYYTHDEIRELIAFYESPLGKKMVDRMPAIMQESMAAGQAWGRELAQKVIDKLDSDRN